MKEVTIRELGGEIWAELFSRTRGGQDKLSSFNPETVDLLIDLIMGVVARHEGESIKNDADLPVVPIPRP